MFVLFICILSYCRVQTCIQKGKLQTAATYLIIIQNLETPIVGKQVSGEQAVTILSSSNLFLCFLIFYSSWLLDCWRLHWSNPVGRLAIITQTFVLWYWVFCYLQLCNDLVRFLKAIGEQNDRRVLHNCKPYSSKLSWQKSFVIS